MEKFFCSFVRPRQFAVPAHIVVDSKQLRKIGDFFSYLLPHQYKAKVEEETFKGVVPLLRHLRVSGAKL